PQERTSENVPCSRRALDPLDAGDLPGIVDEERLTVWAQVDQFSAVPEEPVVVGRIGGAVEIANHLAGSIEAATAVGGKPATWRRKRKSGDRIARGHGGRQQPERCQPVDRAGSGRSRGQAQPREGGCQKKKITAVSHHALLAALIPVGRGMPCVVRR